MSSLIQFFKKIISFAGVAISSIGADKDDVFLTDWQAIYGDFKQVKSFEIKEYWRDVVPDGMRLNKGVASYLKGTHEEWEKNLSFWMGVYERSQVGGVTHNGNSMVNLSQNQEPYQLTYGVIDLYLLRNLKGFFILCESNRLDDEVVSEYYSIDKVTKKKFGFSLHVSHCNEPRCMFVIEFFFQDLMEHKLRQGSSVISLVKQKINIEKAAVTAGLDPRTLDIEAKIRFDALSSWAKSMAYENIGLSIPSFDELGILAIYNPNSITEFHFLRSKGCITYKAISNYKKIIAVLVSCRRRVLKDWDGGYQIN